MRFWRRAAARAVIAWAGAAAGTAALAVASPSAVPLPGKPGPAASMPSAAEIVQRNLAARGGAEAWAKTLTMAWTGHVESSGARVLRTPFVLEQMRPNRTRFEVATQGQTALRIYDGTSGWKLIPSAAGKPELQSYSADELRFARGAQVIEGPLMDYASKHALIDLSGVGEVQGKRAYVLEVRLPDGGLHRVWVDSESFLELRHDRSVRNGAGQQGTVSVFFDAYHAFEGLQIPTTIETRSATGQAINRLVIEKVAVNPPLGLHAFTKPETPGSRHRGAIVDTRSAARTAQPP